MEQIVLSGFSDEIAPELDIQLAAIREWGLSHIELRAADGVNVSDFSPEKVKEVKAKLAAAGVSVSSIGSPLGKISIEEDFAPHLEKVKRTLEIQKELGAPYIRMFSFFIPEGKNPDDYHDQVLEKLKKFAAVAEKYNVVLIHENEKEIYGDIGRRCKVVLDAVGSDHFKAAFDFANFVQCGEDPAECWEMLKDQVVYIHIKDAVYGKGENVVCGTGDGKIPELLEQAICKDGYEGFLTLEPHLVMFDTFKSLETEESAKTFTGNKAANGAEGYAMQYNALKAILDKFM